MREKHKRYYNLQNLIIQEDFVESIDIVLFGNSKELRAQRIPSLLKDKFNGQAFSLNYDVEFEKYTIEEVNITSPTREEELQKIGKDLVSNFLTDLKAIGIDNKTILVDITSLKHPIVFYLIYILKKSFQPKRLFFCYTEPEGYEKKYENEFDVKFDLTEKFHQANTLPGFLRLQQHDKEKLLVAILGFEGSRFSKAFEEVSPAKRKTYTVVGFPSFHPNWQYYVYSKNESTLAQSQARELIERTTANEPFGVYNILREIKRNNENNEITIAPLGTKPHSLGVSMFAADNEDVQLYYDFPSHGKKIRTEGIGKSLLYNLTEYINE
ncbi:hypothetical protein [Tenacibaculum discolor]|uniref:hypothetical protein n=1 Tax=Tenacibaculum discolor TaxID=361581 RepID=UPI000EABF3B1|nr:hypothetical protein [Tenacibaculum discolor]RLJ98801.1 hypothetical protein C8N27_2709 [Tenacibaculum discolor]